MTDGDSEFTAALVKRSDGLHRRFDQYKAYVIKYDGKAVARMFWKSRPKNAGGAGFCIMYRSMIHGVDTCIQEASKHATMECFKKVYLRELEMVEMRRKQNQMNSGDLFGETKEPKRREQRWKFGDGWNRQMV